MSTPYIGEIRTVGFNFAPIGWAFCAGQVMAISQNEVLFSLIGTTYGGDGVQTFRLPDLQGRVPVSSGQGSGLSNYVIGQVGGSETVTLTSANLPSHNHLVAADSGPATALSPVGALPSKGVRSVYSNNAPNAMMGQQAIANSGSNLPHDNLMPCTVISYIIALEGVFPSQS